ncbi:23S rRNA pseudouridylate synthase B, partial [Pseudomonas syringae]|nr:23S rRNA pseudouridylate synthase B [Pseudomonas syringae]
RTLRPAAGAPATGGERAPRQPQITGSERDRPRGGDSTQRPSPRKDSGKPGSRAPRPADNSRGTPVAERPSDMNKRPAKPGPKRVGIKLVNDDAPSGKRRGPPAGSGQRPGFGRRKPE